MSLLYFLAVQSYTHFSPSLCQILSPHTHTHFSPSLCHILSTHTHTHTHLFPSLCHILSNFQQVDKKNQGDQKRIVLLSGIGSTIEKQASKVDDRVIRRAIAPAMRVFPAPKGTDMKSITIQVTNSAHVRFHLNKKVPGSKSVSNRVLVLAALSYGTCRIRGLLHSDDTQVMLNALEKMKACSFEFEDAGDTLVLNGSGGHLQSPSDPLYLGNAGTAVRFLTSVCTLIPPSTTGKPAVITGNARMQQRPIGDLVEALNGAGCSITCMNSHGCPPLRIEPTSLPGGMIRLSANISSQYVSSILLAAPLAQSPVTLDLGSPESHVVSQPYIDMTIAMMKSFGVEVKRDPSNPNHYHVPLAPVNKHTGLPCYIAPASGVYNVEPVG